MTRSLISILFLFYAFSGLSQTNNSNFAELSLDSLLTFNYADMTGEEILSGINQAEDLINSADSLKMEKGTIILAGMAYGLKTNIDSEIVDPKSRDWAEVLTRFESVGYMVHQPMIHRFIKLSTYLCNGNYAHVLKRYRENKIFFPSLAVILFLIYGYFRTLRSRNKSKFQKRFIQVCHVGLLLLFIFWIGFKFTCESNISQYSFYGIPF